MNTGESLNFIPRIGRYKAVRLNPLHQLGDANPEPLGEHFEHRQTNILLSALDFRDVSAINAKAVGHFDLR